MSDTASEARRWPGETLRASGISRSFEGVHALNGVTLELHRHEVVGLIGPNGAGKTTLVNVITGFDFPTEGAVELAGEDITSWQPHRRARAGLARTYQHSRLFKGLSARENVEVAALGVGAGPKEARQRADELLEMLGLGDRADAARRRSCRTVQSTSSASPARLRPDRGSCSWTSRRPASPRRRCPTSPRS